MTDYWKECVASAADECGLAVTDEQLECVAGAVQAGHENYGMAFYSPPAGDRIAEVEREWKAKVKALEQAMEQYRVNAETAVRQALQQRIDANVSIGENGDVFLHGGRTEQIQ